MCAVDGAKSTASASTSTAIPAKGAHGCSCPRRLCHQARVQRRDCRGHRRGAARRRPSRRRPAGTRGREPRRLGRRRPRQRALCRPLATGRTPLHGAVQGGAGGSTPVAVQQWPAGSQAGAGRPPDHGPRCRGHGGTGRHRSPHVRRPPRRGRARGPAGPRHAPDRRLPELGRDPRLRGRDRGRAGGDVLRPLPNPP